MNVRFIAAGAPGHGFVIRLYRCNPRVRHGCQPEAAEDVNGLPYHSLELVFDNLRCQDSGVPEGIEYCEDNIVVHSVGAPS